MKKLNCKMSLLLVILFLINIVPVHAFAIEKTIRIDIPPTSILVSGKPFCADVYLNNKKVYGDWRKLFQMHLPQPHLTILMFR